MEAPQASHAAARRVYVEKHVGFDTEALRLRDELRSFLAARSPELKGLKSLRLINRYDVVGLDEEEFDRAVRLVFAEGQCDIAMIGNAPPLQAGESAFAVEYLPGQYDQRADSAEQCVELAVGTRPRVRTAKVYSLSGPDGPLSAAAMEAVKTYFINPVDSREASLAAPPSAVSDGGPEAAAVPRLDGFIALDDAALAQLARELGLAMGLDDLRFCRKRFAAAKKDPSLAELRLLDTYWSDHCRHSTFTTILSGIEFQESASLNEGTLNRGAIERRRLERALALYEEARRELYGKAAAERPRTLMELATIGAKVLRRRGLLEDIELSEEINACSVRVEARFADGGREPWLLMFKNETHNHPTEIEPFGGAATCLGGAIRDPLSGRAYVHQAMRVTGGADPRAPLSETLSGKLPQLKIAREAAAGYASYGNQIGLATGQVLEFYHPGFLAKRMELGAVIAAVPESWVRRETPLPGDVVLLVGGKTGRDGIGGATGSSKIHTEASVTEAGAEVQKGNAVEERKIQRLFRDRKVCRLIKRCNDFGAGGVAVAVGELAAGLDIDLDAVPKKYEGLDGTELAISESQERMAVVVAAEDAERFIAYAAMENLSATIIARVTDTGRLRMSWRSKTIVDLDRALLDSGGASREARALLVTAVEGFGAKNALQPVAGALPGVSADYVLKRLDRELRSTRSGSRRGLQERFDGSIGASSVLFPWGGSDQATPECGMAALLPSLDRAALSASLMTMGYDPEAASQSPYSGAKAAILEALAKFACLGGDPFSARLSLQEYFEKCDAPSSWGKPLAALLGALEAQLELGVPAIGGKDSMSGSYRDPSNGVELSVPPSLVAFAAGVAPADKLRSGALSGEAGNALLLFRLPNDPAADEWRAFRANIGALQALSENGWVRAAYPLGAGGPAVSLALMAFGNHTGVVYDAVAAGEAGGEGEAELPSRWAGAMLVELSGKALNEESETIQSLLQSARAVLVARTLTEPVFRVLVSTGAANGAFAEESAELPLDSLWQGYESVLAEVYPQTAKGKTVAESAGVETKLRLPEYSGGERRKRGVRLPTSAPPLVVLPVFPGTNCEWDMERAFREAGARTKLVVFRNRDAADVRASTGELARAIKEAEIVALSGGFSAGDEPDGSGKFIANAFRAALVEEAVTSLLGKRDGLMIGICNGFQALIKLGLIPYGEYREADKTLPTLTYNAVGRHVSRFTRTRVMSNLSPWLALDPLGSIHSIPVSHGEGRLVIREEEGLRCFEQGQVAFCYVDADGQPTMAEPDNPNGSDYAIEGLCSPDGRVLGKMGHSERRGAFVHINIPGNKRQNIFEAAVRYFSGKE